MIHAKVFIWDDRHVRAVEKKGLDHVKRNGYAAMIRFIDAIGKDRVFQSTSCRSSAVERYTVFYEDDGLDESIINVPTE